ncbi:MAG: CoA-binding protein, partial [Smithella sp.]
MNSRSFFTSLFEPRAIAFIGASTSPAKWGFNILHHLFRGGYEGPVYAVNAKGGDWFGRPMYRNLANAPGSADLAVIVVPKEKVADALRDCGAAGISAAVVITAGFGETGVPGQALEEEVLRVARACGIRMVGPNTMGIYSAYPRRIRAPWPAALRCFAPSVDRQTSSSRKPSTRWLTSRGFCFPSPRSGAGVSASLRRAEAWES